MRDPLRRAVKLGRNTLPAADIGAGQSRLAQQRESSARFEQPEGHRGRSERLKYLRRQHGSELGAVGGQLGRGLYEKRARSDVRCAAGDRDMTGGCNAVGWHRGVGRHGVAQGPGQDGGGHLGRRYPGRGGELGQLAGRVGGGQAEPLHQRAPGHRDDRLTGGQGMAAIELTPLTVDDRDQPAQVVITGRHGHPPLSASPRPRQAAFRT